MSRDDTYLVDILESAKIALDYKSGKSSDDFYGDLQCQDAVLRRLEIIGEAARHISPQTRKKYPQIPWRDLTVLRNLVIHQYDVELLEDIRDFDEINAAIKRGEEELIPAEVVHAILDGKSPIKVWREYRGLTQQQLADMAGISLSQLETEKRTGTTKVLSTIAEALDVSLEEAAGPKKE